MLLTVVILVALLLSAFFTAAELAIFGQSDARVRTLSEEGYRGSASLAGLRARPQRVLVLLRLGDALSDVTAAAVAGYAGLLYAGITGLTVGAVLAALAILLLGELIPLHVAANHGARIALATSPVLSYLCTLLSPVLRLLEWLVSTLPVRSPVALGDLAESEIRQLTALGHTEGVIEDHERQLIERAFRLDDTKAWDIMTPRVDMFAWPDSLRLADIAPELRTVPYSRVPVYGSTIDDITGVLYLRDVYQALVAGQRDVQLRALAREPLIVPGSVPLSKLLRDFQTRRIHMAIVVDEYGGTDGLVTLEDVLEELVGEIVDETDVAEEPIIRISRSEIEAAGDADLREINHYFNASLPQLEHRSLNGYLLEELGRVPTVGEWIERDGIRIEVLEATETQVLRARLKRVSAPADSAAGPGTDENREDGDRGAAEPPEETVRVESNGLSRFPAAADRAGGTAQARESAGSTASRP
ncbi:MAG TPA: hemolysin family protein [Longimicrobiales bacterium]|nr:hemolysin family protein [Longimicrobiales bacterium]